MDFVSLVKQGGLLWKAWVACHYERRLKRQDYLSVDVKSTCDFLLEHLSGVPLRCLGHLMLGILKILLKQAEDLESKADEVRTSLQTSLSTGHGLPTVPTLSASAVTLRKLEQVQPLDFGGAGFDVLMEEVPEMEVEASLEEGRRHVAPLALITLSPETSSSAKRSVVDPADDEFGAPSAEDLASLAEMGQAALAQIQEEARTPPRNPEPFSEQKEALERSADRESLPPIDFLLGGASSQSEASPTREVTIQAEGEDLAAAAEAAALEAEAFAAEAERAAEEAGLAARCLQELGEMPVEFLLRDADAEVLEDVPMQPLFPLSAEAEQEACLDLMPRLAEEALQEVVEEPRQKRRRKRIWLDEKAIQIPLKKYEDSKKITHENPFEYRIFLPHRSQTIGLTTFVSDLCPLLCAPLRRAAEIGARQRRAKAEGSTLPSPPRALPLGRLTESSLQDTVLEQVVPRQGPALMEADGFGIEPGSPPPVPALEAAIEDVVIQEPGLGQLAEEAAAMVAAIGEPEELHAEELTSTSPKAAVELGPSAADPLPEVGSPQEQLGALPDAEALQLEPADSAKPMTEMQEEPAAQVVGSPQEQLGALPDAAALQLEPADLAKPMTEMQEEPAAQVVESRQEQLGALPDAEVASLPSAKRQAHISADGELVPIKMPAAEIQEVKTEEDVEVDLDKVSAKQGRELRATLQEEAALSFLDLCRSDRCSAEAAACRFVDLLSLHMSGALFLQQDQPYADISVVKGAGWEAWCDESRRGAKRDSRSPAGS